MKINFFFFLTFADPGAGAFWHSVGESANLKNNYFETYILDEQVINDVLKFLND